MLCAAEGRREKRINKEEKRRRGRSRKKRIDMKEKRRRGRRRNPCCIYAEPLVMLSSYPC